MATPFIYPFKDGLGVERFRVEFICESSAEAVAVSQRGASAPIAAAFQPADPPGVVADDATLAPHEALAELAAESQRLGLYDDDEGLAPGEPPRCRANGSCD